MNQLINYLDKKNVCNLIKNEDVDKSDIITSVKLNLMGIKLNNYFLILNCAHFYSFRLKIQNISDLQPFTLLKCKFSLNSDYLEKYFSENHDNPYGIQNVMSCICNGQAVENLTQFPPLHFAKDEKNQREGIERIYKLTKLGDIICTYDRSSGISRLIRKYDKGMWSHMTNIDKDKNIIEATTSGVKCSDFFTLCNPNLDVALYRMRGGISPQTAKEMQEKFDDEIRNITGYNWIGVFFTFLYRRFNIKFSFLRESTYFTSVVIMYTNTLELIDYC